MKDDWKNGRGLKEEHKYKILKLKERLKLMKNLSMEILKLMKKSEYVEVITK